MPTVWRVPNTADIYPFVDGGGLFDELDECSVRMSESTKFTPENVNDVKLNDILVFPGAGKKEYFRVTGIPRA